MTRFGDGLTSGADQHGREDALVRPLGVRRLGVRRLGVRRLSGRTAGGPVPA